MAEKKTKSTALTKTESQQLEPFKLTPEMVHQYINRFATKEEIATFILECKSLNVNPFKKEIYLIKYSEKDQAKSVVAYEVYLKRAERTKNWAGLSFGTEGDGDKMKAWCKIYRKDWKEPLYHEVDYAEYAQHKANGELTAFWKNKPKTMIKKVVLAQGFRLAFPEDFGDLPYIVEEVNDVDIQRLPDAVERFDDTRKIEESFKKEELKEMPEEKLEQNNLPDDKEAPQSMKMDINRLVATLVDLYGVGPEQILEKLDKKVGSHGVNEYSISQAEQAIEYLEWAIDKMEAARLKKQQAKA